MQVYNDSLVDSFNSMCYLLSNILPRSECDVYVNELYVINIMMSEARLRTMGAKGGR